MEERHCHYTVSLCASIQFGGPVVHCDAVFFVCVTCHSSPIVPFKSNQLFVSFIPPFHLMFSTAYWACICLEVNFACERMARLARAPRYSIVTPVVSVTVNISTLYSGQPSPSFRQVDQPMNVIDQILHSIPSPKSTFFQNTVFFPPLFAKYKVVPSSEGIETLRSSYYFVFLRTKPGALYITETQEQIFFFNPFVK